MPLPEDLSDVELLTGSLDDIQPGTSQQISVAVGHMRLESVDSQWVRDDADGQDDVLMLGSQQSLVSSEGQILQRCLKPAYLKSANIGGSLVSLAPFGFYTIKRVKLV